MCQFQNEKIYAEAFFGELQRYPQVLIYGAGQIGKRLAKEIVDRGGRVDRFVVTCITDNDRSYMNIPLGEVQEASDLADTCAIVIAVAERLQYELYQNLRRYGFKNIFRFDEIVKHMEVHNA